MFHFLFMQSIDNPKNSLISRKLGLVKQSDADYHTGSIVSLNVAKNLANLI